MSKERVRVARKKVAEAVATWREEERLRAWYKQPWTGSWFETEKEAAEDATVGKAKVTEDSAVWVEQRSRCTTNSRGAVELWIADYRHNDEPGLPQCLGWDGSTSGDPTAALWATVDWI